MASTVSGAVSAAASTVPDVAIIDFQLPDGDGTDAALAIRAANPRVRVLILTGMTDERTVVAAIDAGCSGLVTKDKALRELIDAVRLVSSGEAYIAPGMLAALLPRLRSPGGGRRVDLTDREHDVLLLMADGLSNLAIAERLVLSIHRVRNHVQNLSAKLQAHSKLEAVVIATRQGLLDPRR